MRAVAAAVAVDVAADVAVVVAVPGASDVDVTVVALAGVVVVLFPNIFAL